MINLANYNEITERLSNIVERYERSNFQNNNYLLYLANGDSINVRFSCSHIAHLLGVNIEYLKTSGKFKPGIGSYDALKYFLEEAFSFSKLCGINGTMNFDNIFSKNIYEKLDAFDINTHIRTDDLLYIIKYNNEKTYQLEDIPDVSDYYIVRKCSDKCYYVLGLVKSEKNDNVYFPSTSRKYETEEDLDKFITRIAKNQELTYPYLLHVTNYFNEYDNNIVQYLDSKIAALRKVIDYSKKYNATAATSSDFLFSINKSKNSLEDKFNSSNLLRFLADSIKNGNVLKESTIYEIVGNIEVDVEVKNLIDACNNLICSNNPNTSAATVQYSELNSENKKLHQELEELKQQLLSCKEQIQDLSFENTELKKQNDIYIEQFSIIEGACQKIKKQD